MFASVLSMIDLMNAWWYSMDMAVTIVGVGAISYGIVQFTISSALAISSRAPAWRPAVAGRRQAGA